MDDDFGFLLSQAIYDGDLNGIQPNLVLPVMESRNEEDVDIFPVNEEDPLALAEEEGSISIPGDITPEPDPLAAPGLIKHVSDALATEVISSDSDIEQTSIATESQDLVQVELFNEDSLLPIYQRTNKSLGTKIVTENIVNGIDPSRISKLVPHQPADNVSFMIGLDFLDHWKDILSDNLGVWTGSGTKSFYYRTIFNRSGRIILKSNDADAVIQCKRFWTFIYHVNSSNVL